MSGQVTLENVLSAPFHEGLVAAAGADVIAWVANDRGSRNVWVAHGPDFIGAPLTDFDGDDGQELGGLQLTPDGRFLLFTRGGAPNRSGWVPTPAQDPLGAERALWWVPSDGSAEPVEVEAGAGVALSPDGTRIAFARQGGIWVMDLPDGEAREIARPRTGGGGLAWSPDGAHLAFVSSRGDHAFVGVLDIETGEYRYLDPSVDRDGSPVWSPDGARIAFIRQPSEKDRLPFFPRRAGQPWSIRVAQVDSWTSQEVFRAERGPGSVFQGVSGPALMWADGDLLVFPWERGGWLRLWSLPASGGEPRLLTPGEHEVQRLSITPDRRRLVFDSNRDDIDRRHLWTVPVGGGEPTLLTPGVGIEWGPVETGGGYLAFLGSGPTMPSRPFVLHRDGGRIRPGGDLPPGFPGDELVVPEAVVFSSTDGIPIHGQLFLPPDLRPGERRPAVLFFHGGSRRQMLLGFHHRGYYHNAYAFNQVLAARGFVVLSVNYRSGIGYGLDFREAEAYGADGGSEVRDVLAAGLYLRSRNDVDPDAIGLWGGSYGGYLTAQGLVHGPDLFAAGVDVHGVHDWNMGMQNFVPDYEPAHHPELAKRAWESSPLSRVEQWEDPVLLIHGDDDRNVRFSETVDLVRILRDMEVEVETLVFPDEVHGFLLHRNWLAAYRAALDFFERHLVPE
ncbi:MAG: S9 family peptidase [Gemmatimonadales bacterium]|nr:MAG: S9 family peptidase [Gemmatimonadales bacterium]